MGSTEKQLLRDKQLTKRQVFGNSKSGDVGVDSPLADKLLQLKSNDGLLLSDPRQVSSLMIEIDDLVNDSRSPIVSMCLNLLEYQNGSDIVEYNEFARTHEKECLQKYIK